MVEWLDLICVFGRRGMWDVTSTQSSQVPARPPSPARCPRPPFHRFPTVHPQASYDDLGNMGVGSLGGLDGMGSFGGGFGGLGGGVGSMGGGGALGGMGLGMGGVGLMSRSREVLLELLLLDAALVLPRDAFGEGASGCRGNAGMQGGQAAGDA